MGYKDEKELFVSDGEGSSIFLINSVCATALTTFALWKATSKCIYQMPTSWRSAAAEFVLLVAPLLLVLTALSSVPFLVNMCLSVAVVIISPRERLAYRPVNPPSPVHLLTPPGTPLRPPTPVPRPSTPLSPKGRASPSKYLDSPSYDISINELLGDTRKRQGPVPDSTEAKGGRTSFSRPYLTAYRAHMLLMTALCILAVDFPVFPRSFGKTETWGTSLMDVGVGSFVFSLGIVSAIPTLRLDTTPFHIELRKALLHTLPLLLMGLARVAMVKGVDLPEHVTEYGVHWNFFITLSALPFLGVLSRRLYRSLSFSLMGAAVTATHQTLLSIAGLQSWCLDSPRIDWLTANKEGITSLLGYCAIFLFGVDCGLYALPPDPYFAKTSHRKKLRPNPGKTATLFASWSIVWWLAYCVFAYMTRPSRRLANASYVLWTVATNVTLLLFYILIAEWKVGAPATTPSVPLIFDAINKNGLAFFLVANLLTGIVNLTIKSMYASDLSAVIILLVYGAAIIAFAWVFRRTRLKI